MSKFGIIVLAGIIMFGCESQNSESNTTLGKYHSPEDVMLVDEEAGAEYSRTAKPPRPEELSIKKGSKIIKNGNMNFEVTRLEMVKSAIDSILEEHNGYYENEQYHSYGNRNSYSLQLRIPNTKFDSIVSVLEHSVGKLKSKNISAKDVTEEYVDLNIRLDNNLAYLKQYKEILKKAKSVKEILEVREKIRRIEEEIESKKGRLKYLDDKVKFSTLNLEITELIIIEISNKPSFGRRLTNAFNNGIQGFLSFVVGLVNLWPFLLIAILIFMGRKPIMDGIRRNKKPSNRS